MRKFTPFTTFLSLQFSFSNTLYRVHQTTSPYDLSPSNRDSWAFSSRVSLLVALLVPLWRALCSKVKRACTFATGSDVAGPRRRHGRTTELVTIVSHQANTGRRQSLHYFLTPVVTFRIFSGILISRKIRISIFFMIML